MSSTIYKPGQIVPISGQYAVVNAHGRRVGREVTCVRGERFPPLRIGEHGFVLTDATRHLR